MYTLKAKRIIAIFYEVSRISWLVVIFIILNSKQNIYGIDIVLEPLLLGFGMKQVRKSLILLFNFLK